jgi:membrane-bound serine protease (ClpP class)
MMLGFGALDLEYNSPGFGIFGILGILFLAIAFGSKYAVGLADHTEMLILLGGFALFMVEIYLIPGTFIAGGLGLLMMVAALVLSLQDFVIPDPEMPWEMTNLIDNLALTLGMAVAALIIPLFAAKYLLPALPRRMQILLPDTLSGARALAPEVGVLRQGMHGVAKTGMRPSGKAIFDGKTFEVTADGAFIESGSPVQVVHVEGDRVRVRLISENPS